MENTNYNQQPRTSETEVPNKTQTKISAHLRTIGAHLSAVEDLR